MPYEIIFKQDTEITGVGTVIANHYIDVAGVKNFSGHTYSRKVNTKNALDKTAFCNEAKQDFALWDAKKSADDIVATNIKNEINT